MTVPQLSVSVVFLYLDCKQIGAGLWSSGTPRTTGFGVR